MKCTCREDNLRDWRGGHGLKGRVPDRNCPVHVPEMRTIYNNESFWWRPDGFDKDRNYSEERG